MANKIDPLVVTEENFGDLLIESLKEHVAINEGQAEPTAVRRYLVPESQANSLGCAHRAPP